MLEALLARVRALVERARRIERRELQEFRRWIEETRNLLQLSVLVFVPLLIGLVTYAANSTRLVSFLIFPPLASGTYTFFAEPEGRFSSPGRFVAGMTIGALCGWIALEAVALWGTVPSGVFQVSAAGAALGVLLTGVTTWALDVQEPAAFSTALLFLLIGTARLEFVVGITLSSALVAALFVVWRDRFYQRRADFLYRSTRGDDHVLVPVHVAASNPGATARFGAAIAAAHEAGKVVLLDVVDDLETARAHRKRIEAHDTSVVGGEDAALPEGGANETPPAPGNDPAAVRDVAVAEAATALEGLADEIERQAGVPCEVVVAVGAGWTPAIVERSVAETGCDLVVAPHERHDDGDDELERFVRGLFRLEVDVIAFRSADGDVGWRSAMVPVRSTGDVANAMVDFARRITGSGGRISVCHCITSESQRRRAESMLANLVEAFPGEFETRVANESIDEFLDTSAPAYDVIFLGASTDRAAVSRFFSRPTFERLEDVDADVAIVHRGSLR